MYVGDQSAAEIQGMASEFAGAIVLTHQPHGEYRDVDHASVGARGADASSLTAEGDQPLLVAVAAADGPFAPSRLPPVPSPVTHRPVADPRLAGADSPESAQILAFRCRSTPGRALRRQRPEVRILSGDQER